MQEIYKLAGILNLFNVVPDFVYPVFERNNQYYFMTGDEDTLKTEGYIPVIGDDVISEIGIYKPPNNPIIIINILQTLVEVLWSLNITEVTTPNIELKIIKQINTKKILPRLFPQFTFNINLLTIKTTLICIIPIIIPRTTFEVNILK